VHDVLLAVDIGTTNVKGAIFPPEGSPASASKRISLEIDSALGTAEQDPEEIAQAVFSVIKELASKVHGRVGAVAFSSQMHALGTLSRSGRPKTKLLTYFDTRAAPLAREVEKVGYELYLETGCPPLHVYPLAKILYLKSRGAVESGDRFLLSAKDYVLLKLTGEHVLDLPTASGSQLLDVKRLRWSGLALSLAGLDESSLPRLVEGEEPLPVTREAAEQLGLPSGTPVYPGVSDAAANQLGVGATREGELAVNLGTSAAVRALSEQTIFDDERMRFFVYYAGKGRWLIGGAVNNGGIVLEWLASNFLQAEVEYARLASAPLGDLLDRVISSSPPGARGLVVLPFLAGGERFPVRSSAARGLIYGLSLAITRADIARAMLEGVAFTLRWIYSAMLERGVKKARLLRVGGGAASLRSWRQILADVFEASVCYSPGEESALKGLYTYIRGSEVEGCGEILEPSAEGVATYRRVFEEYVQLCELVKAAKWAWR